MTGTLDISEYIDTSHGNLVEPPVAHQSIVLDVRADLPAVSALFGPQTRCIRIVSDIDVRVAIGTKPVEGSLLKAGHAEKRIVEPGQGFRLYAVAAGDVPASGSAAGAHSTASLIDLINILANPAKTKATLQQLARTQADIEAASAQFSDLKSKADALAKSMQQFEAERSAEMERMRDARDELAAERGQLTAEKQDHAHKVAALAADRAALETDKRAHELRLAELERMKRLLAA